MLDAVQCAAGQLGRLEDGDTAAIHLPVADEECGRGQRADARSDDIRGLLVHALRLAGAGERFEVATLVVHCRLLSLGLLGTRCRYVHRASPVKASKSRQIIVKNTAETSVHDK